jgi:protein gp37
MADTAIEWADFVWNPVRGCSRVSAGCGGSDGGGCYAERQAYRFSGPGGPYEGLIEPLRWKKPRRIFVDSMSDLFHEAFPFEYIAEVFAIMAISPRHTYQILTKRPERAVEFFRWLSDDPAEKIGDAAFNSETIAFEDIDCTISNYINGWSRFKEYEDGNPCNGTVKRWPLPNVWIGTSISNQPDADKNIPTLLQIPAAVRFVSCEPLLGPIDLTPWLWSHMPIASLSPFAVEVRDEFRRNLLHWVIVGAESGPKARPCNVAWIRSAVEQCKAAGTACFVKQLGANVIDRNDVGFEGDELDHWPVEISRDGRVEHLTPQNWQGDPVRIRLRDRKGGDWNEWPNDLRVRQFPEARV